MQFVAQVVTCLLAIALYRLIVQATKPRNRIWESMSRFTLGRRVIRVWRTESIIGPSPDLVMLFRTFNDNTLDSEIFDKVGSMPGVAAVEILLEGNGLILYPDWQ